jgi:hypothetical protein
MYKINPVIENLELSHNLLDDNMLKYNKDQMLYFIKNLCDQQLGIKNSVEFVLDPGDDVLATVTAIICFDKNISVSMEVSRSIIAMNKGDVLIFPSEMNYTANGSDNFYVLKVNYRKDLNLLEGSKTFNVTATLIDKYSITVSAENESEAIEKAKLTSISKWSHLDLYPEVQERKVIRYAKWNNFEAKGID